MCVYISVLEVINPSESGVWLALTVWDHAVYETLSQHGHQHYPLIHGDKPPVCVFGGHYVLFENPDTCYVNITPSRG